MYKLSINKDLFEKVLLKKIHILEKENNNYWKKELLEPIIKDDKLTYTIKQIKKLFITNGLGDDKPQLLIECLKVDYSIEKGLFEFHLGKILEQKNIPEVDDEKDILIKQLLDEKKELMNILEEIKKSKLFKN
ncbi:MAG: hypothetical protein AB7S49_06160 [Arcobacter sp.]|uniref:Uncharacterized protein n=1 Tax=Arcobacter defluvii TaxID=873191 RepID=A0AAE7BDP1_9BACT|nr:hypothetical protein [Arcobacter defluvii]QKF77411.1 hypothetical protein ADFLV_1381 [Arcobacter defluvii]RXI32130.1 hypothetical protein CP964_09140 [Arcobacter defluvii]